MATHPAAAESGQPFPLEGKPTSPWKETALTRIAEQRFVLNWLRSQNPSDPRLSLGTGMIEDHWRAAADAAKGTHRGRLSRWFPGFGGAEVERVTSQIDAVDADLLRLGPLEYLNGQFPGILADVRHYLRPEDPRRKQIEDIASETPPRPLDEGHRDLLVAAHHAARGEARREVKRLRNFKNLLLATAAVLALGAIGGGVFGALEPSKVPLCFAPNDNVVCATTTERIGGAQTVAATPGQVTTISQDRVDRAMRRAASSWDIPLIEGIGLVAAAIAAAASLRRIRGTSTPYSLPVALALLKLPTGALTAAIGLILMRGQFVPGLSALDSSAQILAWAVIFGYSQQLLTRFVDQHAQTVLDNLGKAKGSDSSSN
jgi:hypothetical protein